MLTLYHGDTSVCAAKVRVTLAEKQIPWDGIMIDLGKGEQFQPEYLKLNPNAVVPTLVHDGQVVIESTIINEYLDEAFPERSLRPGTAHGRARMRLWTKREDGIHDAINTMTTAMLFRGQELEKTPEQRAARVDGMPDPARRKKWRTLIEEGVHSDIVMGSLVRFALLFRDMEQALGSRKWLAGDDFTLADIGLISYFYRLELLEIAGIWEGRFPAVTDWYARMKERPSFAEAVSGHVPAVKAAAYLKYAGPAAPAVLEHFGEAIAIIGA